MVIGHSIAGTGSGSKRQIIWLRFWSAHSLPGGHQGPISGEGLCFIVHGML